MHEPDKETAVSFAPIFANLSTGHSQTRFQISRACGVDSNYKSEYERHHIVAKNAIGAQRARDILKEVGIQINSDENMVFLKTGVHRRLHTKIYYFWINKSIELAYLRGANNKEMQNYYVTQALIRIKVELIALNILI